LTGDCQNCQTHFSSPAQALPGIAARQSLACSGFQSRVLEPGQRAGEISWAFYLDTPKGAYLIILFDPANTAELYRPEFESWIKALK
jgi:hypothetical protein